MDPLTLFALANGAVSAVKAGCKLYKDIKGAAGEVKDVLKDLDSQFHKMYDGRPVPRGAVWFEPTASVGTIAATGFAVIFGVEKSSSVMSSVFSPVMVTSTAVPA